MRNMLTRLKNQFSDFWGFYFLSYGRFCSQLPSVFTLITDQKFEMVSQNMRNVLKRIKFLTHEFLIVRFLVFEIWSILY